MGGGQAKMRGVIRCDRRDDALSQQPLGNLNGHRRVAEHWQTAEGGQPRCRESGVASAYFFEHGFRDEQIKVLPACKSPED